MTFEVALQEICSHIVDCPHATAPASDEAYAFAVGTKAIQNGRIQFDRAKPVDGSTYKKWITRLKPEPGDVILCREAPVGPVAQVPHGTLVCLGQRTVLLRPKTERVDPRYLRYLLGAPPVQRRLGELAEGSTVPHLNIKDVRNFRVSLPQLADQQRISWVLASLDDKIETNRRIAENLEQLVATLFKARFVDFVDQDDLAHTEIGPIPRGWSVRPISEVGVVYRDIVKGPSDLPYIGLDAMPRGSTVLSDWATGDDAPNGPGGRFVPGDILFGKLRPYFRKVGVASVEGRCSTEILVLRPTNEVYYGLLLGHVSSQPFIDHCTAVSHGTRMPRAEWKDAGAYMVAIPPTELAEEFSALVRSFYGMIGALTRETDTLAAIRDALLPRLISGELRVPPEEGVAMEAA